MNFLSPAFLIGLPLVAVPLVIHLLSRRQQKKISWGAMRFLMQAVTRKRRLWRLTDILLLLLRTAAFLFFIFALARPLLPATWLGSSVPREVIVVLDQSMSMSRKIDGNSLFELQLQKAHALLDDLKGSDTIRLLLAGESPEWLTPDSLPASAGTIRKLHAQINELKPTLGAADIIACVREAADLEAPKDKSARVIVVITDGQRFGWRLEERPLWAAVQTRIKQAAIPTSVGVHLVGGEEPAANLCVNKIEALRAFGAVNQALTFTASVQNHSPKPSAPTLLNWHVDGKASGASTVPELAPDASTTVSIHHQFDAPGTFEVTCQLESHDELAADNSGNLLVEIFERLPVLLVEDPVSAEPLENDAPFVLAALGASKSDPRREWRSVFDPAVIDSSAIVSTDLARFRCVLIANVRTLNAAAVEKLEAYVQNGGGVWLALGAQTDESVFNDNLYRGGLGLAPMKITTPVGDPNDREKFFTARAASDTHPATVLLADFQRLDLDRARIYRRHQFDAFSGKDVSILLQAQGGEPVAIERKLGRGRVIVQGVPLGVSWSTLPLCQAYVAMLHEWFWYLSEPSLPKRNLAVGEAIVEPAAKENSPAELIAPDGREIELAASPSSRGAQFRYGGTRLPGPYFLSSATGNASQTAKFYVQRNAQESDLSHFTDRDREHFAGVKEFSLNGDWSEVGAAGKAQAPKHPLEGFLLVALACVLLGEIALAGWTTHRRNLRVQPVSMEA
ncbi:MAG: BatA domain-containing protein [Verrucomicrobia subdivision 3 bacterium]|nr:BatA domain-containing protein [Limisphaerales bacterium]